MRLDVPGVTDAVLTIVPVAVEATVPVMTNVTELPAVMSTGLAIEPDPRAAPHDEPGPATQVHVTLPNPDGTASVTIAPMTSLGP
jgi:hypothetical protein